MKILNLKLLKTKHLQIVERVSYGNLHIARLNINLLLCTMVLFCTIPSYTQTIKYNKYIRHDYDRRYSKTDYISDPDGLVNGHGYVDLGLPSGTRWAVCNVGASQPEKRGIFISWGNNTSSREYRKENTKLYYDESVVNISGFNEYDAATFKWGSEWKTPSWEQFDELFTKCKWEWCIYNGVEGTKLTGPNGQSIFLPAYGFAQGLHTQEDGIWSGMPSCRYWTSNKTNYGNDMAVYICSARSGAAMSSHPKFYGLLVRPVLK